jgi:hypothetical protein
MAANYDQTQDIVKRVRFFDGQFLKDQDFIDDQKYHIDRQRHPNRVLRVSGICEGLTLTVDGSQLKVTTGTALDSQGRLIILAGDSFAVDLQNQTGILDIFISYGEEESDITQAGNDRTAPQPSDSTPSDKVQGAKGATRWLEKPRIEAVKDRSTLTGEFPIWLGRVTISGSGNNRTIALTTTDDREYSGIYLPSSANPFEAPVLRSGGNLAPKLAILTGDLKVRGTTSTAAAAGLNVTNAANTSLLYVRNDGNVGIGTTTPEATLDIRGNLRVGDGAGSTRLIAGSTYFGLRDNSGADRLTILQSNGNVGIGTTTPAAKLAINGGLHVGGDSDPGDNNLLVDGNTSISGTLGFGSSTRQMINLWGVTNYGIGVQNSTQYFRTDKNFAWYKGGTHTNDELGAGTNGTVQMAIRDGNVGIGTTTAESKLTINTNIAHDNAHATYGDAPVTIFEPTSNGGSSPSGTRDILNLVREGVADQSYGNKVSLAIGRYENAGVNSRTQLDIKLTDGAFNSHNSVMTLRSNGNVSIAGTITATKFSGDGAVITGMIVMWSGSVNAVPSGWALCNGQNGTPNLVDRFILGASEDASARAGGTSTHSHSTGHGSNATRDVLTGVAAAGKSFDNVSDEIHSHGVSESSHVPPFYKLAFIIKR